ncbi:MAG TPA: leucine--tRNA ligase [Candidatus Paceibacterota bacterium]|nr:leucine--tRNA ligase [Candidatus Pacearchaeota archaeon]HRZ50735.1 leucine--tRNA ligase [Candidatus Paceibacterota bacterium]HSA36368.1 leucine--tRNA ligase [Candidatus Paceibacterota bacterium]
MPKKIKKTKTGGIANKPGYNHKSIEKKWQKAWEEQGIFSADDASAKTKFYSLDMFPYPSAYGLHVGHFKGYTLSDVIAKRKMMDGCEVLRPIGFDAFGLPAENFAIKTGIHPTVVTKKSIKNIRRQFKAAGLGYDWSREVIASSPDYYRWTQWMFLQLYKNGLAFRKKAPVNFCPSCKTVLANEQVVDGRCERCGSTVAKKLLEQWFFKITDYAERLLEGLDNIDWPEKIKTIQRNWIGKSYGTDIQFSFFTGTKEGDSRKLEVFTTRADTLFGCTYVVIAPEHPILEKLKPLISNWDEAAAYMSAALAKTEIERSAEDREKTGVELKGVRVVNPVNNTDLPVFIADYVLMDYGTGAVMAVPAHDQRDFLFAKKHKLPIVEVIKPKTGETTLPERAYEDYGVLQNSEVFSGLDSESGAKDIAKYLEKRGQGRSMVHYKLRDWLISRQRYWGAPIPMVICEKCGWQPVSESELPVLLPRIKDFKPTSDGKSPLARNKAFVKAVCPKCGGKAERETETMDTFVCSSWYFFRYTDPKNKAVFAAPEKIAKWLPVDLYIGGVEHAVLHLLYSRFFTKALKDFGYLDFEEPFLKLFSQGTIYYQGAKMSKSKGNVISPDKIIAEYGADTLRLYELFMGPMDQSSEWSDNGLAGIYRFLHKVWHLQYKVSDGAKDNQDILKLLHKTIKKVGNDLDSFRTNTAISALMILANELDKQPAVSKDSYLKFITMLAPMAPHLSEELWQIFGQEQSIFKNKWPAYDENLIQEKTIFLIVQVNGKTRGKIEIGTGVAEKEAKILAKDSEIVHKWVAGKEIVKTVYVPGKLINFVIKP